MTRRRLSRRACWPCATALCLACDRPAHRRAGGGRTEPPLAGILILNQERLFAQSLYGQRIQRELEDASSARLAAENRRIEAALTDEELALTELRATTEADAFREMADAFDTRVEAIRAAQEAKARDLTAQADAAQASSSNAWRRSFWTSCATRNAAVLMDSRAVLAVGRPRRRDRDGHRRHRRGPWRRRAGADHLARHRNGGRTRRPRRALTPGPDALRARLAAREPCC
jgi:hypothetical protein